MITCLNDQHVAINLVNKLQKKKSATACAGGHQEGTKVTKIISIIKSLCPLWLKNP
jgi:hypothetical protein